MKRDQQTAAPIARNAFKTLLISVLALVCLSANALAVGAGGEADAAQYLSEDGWQITPELVADSKEAAAENTRVLQEATDKASEQKGTVILPKGTFYFASAGRDCLYSGGRKLLHTIGEHVILCRNDVTYVGQGAETVLKPIGVTQGGLDMFYFNDFLDSGHETQEYLENNHFRNFVVDSDETWCLTYTSAGKAFMLNLCKNCTWEKVSVYNTDGTGFGMDCTVDCWINDCYAWNCGKSCTETGPGGSGFGIGYGYANEESMVITNCVSRCNKKFGYFFENQARFNPLYLATTHGEFSARDCVSQGNLGDYGGLMSTGVLYENCQSLGARKYAFYFGVSSHDVEVKNCSATVQYYDIAEDSPYYDALRWAVSNAVTLGRDDGTFGAEEPCTRGQLLAFLWRMAGMPLTDASLSYADVSGDSFYAPAVRWALSRGMIGASMNFGPERTVTAGELDKWTSSLRPAFSSGLSGEITRGDVMNALFRFAQTNE